MDLTGRCLKPHAIYRDFRCVLGTDHSPHPCLCICLPGVKTPPARPPLKKEGT